MRSLNVVVISDDIGLGRSASFVLESAGHSAATLLVNAHRALHLFPAAGPGVGAADVYVLAICSGADKALELCERLGRNGSGCPVVVVQDYRHDLIVRDELAEGGAVIVSPNLSAKALTDAVAEAVGSSGRVEDPRAA